MVKKFNLTFGPDSLSILEEVSNARYPVKKKGATGAPGQLFSRQFLVFDEGGNQLFRVVDGNSGTYPRASLVIDGKETFVLTAGGKCFRTECSVRGQQAKIVGDPFSSSFTLSIENGESVDVSAKRGGGETVYSCTVNEDASALTTLSILATIAVFRGRTIPCLEP